MATKRDVIEALRSVQDPELDKSLVELGMIHDVRVDDGEVEFTLALTTMACPLRENIVDDAKAAVAGLDGVGDVQVTVREMTDEEKRHALGRQRQKGAAEELNNIDQVIAVMSGKGGVGKSSVAALLAASLARRGRAVGLLDADITGPSIPKMFGLHGTPPAGPKGIMPAESRTGIRVMSINLLLPSEDEAVVWRGPLIGGAIRQFWGDVFWGDLDALVVDLPPGTSDASLTVMQSIPLNGVVMVMSPQELAGMVVRKAAKMATQLKIPIVGLVENMSYVECPTCGERIDVFGPSKAEETAEQLGVPLLGRLPLDPELSKRADMGQIEAYPRDAFAPIVDAILERLPDAASEPIMP
jgi:Mrp family chromosome partitioning ATPase